MVVLCCFPPVDHWWNPKNFGIYQNSPGSNWANLVAARKKNHWLVVSVAPVLSAQPLVSWATLGISGDVLVEFKHFSVFICVSFGMIVPISHIVVLFGMCGPIVEQIEVWTLHLQLKMNGCSLILVFWEVLTRPTVDTTDSNIAGHCQFPVATKHKIYDCLQL